MTFLGRVTPVAFAVGLGSFAFVPRAHAMLRAAAARDLSVEIASPLGLPADASPSIVATADGQWIAWVRTPADVTVTNWSSIMLSRATLAGGVDHTPGDLPIGNAYLYDVAVAYDGTDPVVFFARGSADVNSLTEVGFWHPARSLVVPVTGYTGRSLDLNGAPYIDHGLMPFVASYTMLTGGVPTSTQYYISCDGSYASCMFNEGPASTAYFDGRAASVSGEARYFMSRSDSGNASVRTLSGDLVAVPNAHHVVSDFFSRDTGEYITLTGTGATSVRLSRIDTAGAVHLALPAPITTMATVNEVALAPDRAYIAWMGAIENGRSQIEVIAEDGTPTLLRVMLRPPAGYPSCQRVHMAPFAADANAVAVIAQCSDPSATVGHIFYWVVRRLSAVAEDAGTDAAFVDAPVEAGEDVTDVATSTDVTANDAPANDVVDAAGADAGADGSSAFDVVVDPPGTGPGFRGSGCNCTVPSTPAEGHGRVVLGALGLAAAWVQRRRARSS